MAFAARLELRQRQSLVITPQLQQAIKLLQFSNLDLQAFVERELEQNPFLERDSGAETDRGDDASDAPRTDEETALFAEACEPEHAPDGAYEAAEAPWLSRSSSSLRSEGFGDDFDLTEFAAPLAGLRAHLTEQLRHATQDSLTRLIGEHIIDMVDDNGYVRGDLEAVAELLNAPKSAVDATLDLLQSFDPAGVCARDLTECLRLQLRERNRLDPYMESVLRHLDLVASQDLPKLRKVTALSVEDLTDAIAELRALNPRPGLGFCDAAVEAVTPDVFVRRQRGGGWSVEINQETLPKLLVNQAYYASVTGAVKSDAERSYLTSTLGAANWLIKSLDQRTRTILKVAQEIVRQQEDFFIHGVHRLRPLNLRDVAQQINMHESTVSRVTSNKYMATPRGMFELKYFFTSAIANAGRGEQHSSEAVRHRIRKLVDAEKPSAVLSDDQIVMILKREGVDIARRTVAKYRESMRISSSVLRRRQKRGGVLQDTEQANALSL